MSKGKFLVGMALGALAGNALSRFARSSKGRQLKKDIYAAIQDLREDAYDYASHAKHKAGEVGDEVADKVSSKAQEMKGKWDEATKK